MMLNSIQAYFPSEDKAETAKASLLSYEIEILEVSKLENTEEERDIPVTGIVPGSIGGGMSSGLINVNHSKHRNNAYVLSANVKKEDYDAVVAIIQANQGEL